MVLQQLQAKIKKETKDRLRITAAIRDCTIADLVEELLSEGLDRIDALSPPPQQSPATKGRNEKAKT